MMSKTKKIFKSVLSLLLSVAVLATSFIGMNFNVNVFAADSNLISFTDDFERDSITRIDSGWVEQIEGAQGSTIDGGILKLTEGGTNTGHYSNLIMRSMSEKTTNQKVSVNVNNLADHFVSSHTVASANVHVRVQRTDAKYTTSYYAAAQDSFLKIGKTVSADGNAEPEKTIIVQRTGLDLRTGRTYKIELSAEGVYPTTLTATLYNVTDNEVIATITATDSTPVLQNAGTVGVSVTNNNANAKRTAAMDTFTYNELNTVSFADDFERNTITENASGWVEQIEGAQGSLIDGGVLKLTEGGTNTGHYSNLITRPITEAATNQNVSVNIKNLADHFVSSHTVASANVHVRVQGTDAKYATSYYAAAQDSFLKIGKTVSADGNTEPEKTIIVQKTDLDLATGKTYKLELTAEGTNPTTLTATLYNVTDNVEVATIIATDSTEVLQNAGTVGLSVTNNNSNNKRTATMDTFVYNADETTAARYSFADDFERESITGSSTGWIEQIEGAQGSVIDDGVLKLTEGGTNTGHYSNLIMRPLSESAINQKVSVEINNLADHFVSSHTVASANVHVRVQDVAAVRATSYYAAAQDSFLKIGRTVSVNGVSEPEKTIIVQKTDLDLNTGKTYKLELTAEGTNPTTLTATLYNVTDNVEVATITATDSTEALQNAGTVGLSVTNNNANNKRTAAMDNFTYTATDDNNTGDDNTGDDGTDDNNKSEGIIVDTTLNLNNSFTDDFNRATITGNHSGWIEKRADTKNTISSGVLHLKDTSSELLRGYGHDLVMRPMSEAAVNQKASMEIKNLASLIDPYASANLHLRLVSNNLQSVNGGSTVWYDQSYYVRVSSTSLQIARTYPRDNSKDMGSAVLKDSLGNDALVKYNAIDGAHTYELVFTTEGSFPTTLTATLYDITNNVVVATVEAIDNTPALQVPGTSALSMCGGGASLNKTAYIDNYEYYQYDSKVYFQDNFEQTDITNNNKSNGWIEQAETVSGSSANYMDNGTLRIADGEGNGHTHNLVARPMSEVAINQKASVIVSNLGHVGWGGSSANVHVRVSDAASQQVTSYYASLSLQSFSIRKSASTTPLATKTYDATISDQPYIIELKATGTYPTVLTARFYKASDGTLVDELTCTDSTSQLQRPGTVGLSVTKSSSSGERKGAFDNFFYERTNTDIYYDEFERSTITGNDSGWIEQIEGAQGSKIESGVLKLTEGGTNTGFYCNLIMRPASESAVNQKASVNINNLADHFVSSHTVASTNVHLRVQSTNSKYATSYYAAAQDSFLKIGKTVSADGNTEPEKSVIAQKTDLNLATGKTYKLELAADGAYPTTLTATLYNVTDNEVVATLTQTDSTAVLQKTGTAGISVTNNNSNNIRTALIDSFTYERNYYVASNYDFNGDEICNINDVTVLRNHLVDNEALTDVAFDLNADGDTNVCDLVAAYKFVSNSNKDRAYIIVGGGSDEEADAMRESIVLSQKAKPTVTGTTYYISPNGKDTNNGTSPETPWKSLNYDFLFWSHKVKEGDAILFERGGVYRQTETINIDVGNVYFGAYGTGAKPEIYGSAEDYVNATWKSVGENIWRISNFLSSADAETDAGIVVFNNGSWAGRLMSSTEEFKKNGDFYHDTENKVFYLYCDEGNPSDVYSNIEIGVDRNIIGVFNDRDNVTIDNLSFKYTGGHAISLYQNNDNITITNCELGWIGGSIQNGATNSVRYGNAIQIWDNSENITVENNWIYEVYDAGFTFQFSDHDEGREGGRYQNIKFINNLVEYCTYSVEFFTESIDAYAKDITISNNIMRFAGYGWGNQRPHKEDDSHINGWSGNTDYDSSIISNFKIENNIFDCSTTQIINWRSDVALSSVAVRGNTFYEKAYGDNLAINYGTADKAYADSQAELEAAIAIFDSEPKLVKWMSAK